MSGSRSSWESADRLQLIEKLVSVLRNGAKTLEPGGPVPGDPVQLQGLEFPTVTLCQKFELPTVVASSIAGRQEFEDATLRRVDLSRGNLDFSVWSQCRFRNVLFDHTSLKHARFLGCTFEDCAFPATDFGDCGITLSRKGTESTFLRCRFEKASFPGASIFKANFADVEFRSCSMKRLRFDEAMLERTRFVGNYPELRFRGTLGEPVRNRLDIDLSEAKVGYLDANGGIDLSAVIPPKDGSLAIFKDRLRTVATIFTRLAEELPAVRKIADHFRSDLSSTGISPLSSDQSTYALSTKRIAACDNSLSEELVLETFRILKRIANEEQALLRSGD